MPSTDPSAWARVLETQGPLGLALVVLVVMLAAAVGLITVLIRYMLKDQRVPTSVWAEECKSHGEILAAVSTLAEASRETTLTLRLLFNNRGGA